MTEQQTVGVHPVQNEMHTREKNYMAFLQWALPQLGMRWRGYQNVHRQVGKRLRRRVQVLELDGLAAYRAYLENYPEEWKELDAMCRITISRFYRDWALFDALRDVWMPKLAQRARRQGRPFAIWSAGCASGEEPYTLSLIGKFVLETTFPDLSWSVIATDADPHMLARAHRACYTGSSFKELPPEWIARAFARCGEEYCLDEVYRRPVTFLNRDIRESPPSGPFDLILCRYLVGTYYERSLQTTVFSRMAEKLLPGGLLVLGNQETLPEELGALRPLNEELKIYQKADEVNS